MCVQRHRAVARLPGRDHPWDDAAECKALSLTRLRGFLFETVGSLFQEFESNISADTGVSNPAGSETRREGSAISDRCCGAARNLTPAICGEDEAGFDLLKSIGSNMRFQTRLLQKPYAIQPEVGGYHWWCPEGFTRADDLPTELGRYKLMAILPFDNLPPIPLEAEWDGRQWLNFKRGAQPQTSRIMEERLRELEERGDAGAYDWLLCSWSSA